MEAQRSLTLFVISLFVVVATLGSTFAASSVCDGFQYVEGQGPSCPVPHGWLVLLEDGTRVLTHGPDRMAASPVEAAEGSGMSFPSKLMPTCVADPASNYHNLVIYAFPNDKTSRHETMANTLRDLVNRSEARLRMAAGEFDADRGYLFACDAADKVTVAEAALPFPSGDANFANIVNALRQQGYVSSVAKYWVWYDGSVSGIAGQGHAYGDDRLTINNNANSGGSFAITYGITGDYGVRVLMHENGHNLGAVQSSAPHSSGAFHCNDGLDVMCYADGGPTSNYTASACAAEMYDCNNDDYFHPAPPPGSYLATHWNLGSELNRFFSKAPPGPLPPTITLIHCQPNPAPVGEQVRCYAQATDYESIAYHFDWGDGTSNTSALTRPETAVSFHHAWYEQGNHTVTVTATDAGTPPLSSTRSIQVEIKCTLLETGRLLVGLRGLETTYSAVDKTVKPGCDEKPYTLTGPEPTDFDVCWYDADGTLISCDHTPGNQSGRIPTGAATARIILMEGFNGNYRLQAT